MKKRTIPNDMSCRVEKEYGTRSHIYDLNLSLVMGWCWGSRFGDGSSLTVILGFIIGSNLIQILVSLGTKSTMYWIKLDLASI